jgi:hypothetical protein
MPANKSHHYTPKFLLKNFSDDPAKRSIRLFRVSARCHVDRASIRNQCARDYFYGTNGEVEGALGEIEGRTAEVIREVRASGTLPDHDSDDYGLLLTFIAYQWTRTPVATDRENAFHTALAREVARLNPTLRADADIDELMVRSAHPVSSIFYDAGQHVQILGDLNAKLLRNATNVEYLIGDAPVVFHNQWCRRAPSFGGLGYASAGLQIFLPIGPEDLLVLYDRDVYEVGDSAKDVATIVDPAEVRAFNALQFAAAEDVLFYKSGTQRAEVEAISQRVRDGRLGVRVDSITTSSSERYLQASCQPLNVDLLRGTVRIRLEAVGIPRQRRNGRHRPAAREVAKRIEGSRRHSRGDRAVTTRTM